MANCIEQLIVLLEHIVEVKICNRSRNRKLSTCLSKTVIIFEIGRTIIGKWQLERDSVLTHYAICSGPEVASGVIQGRNVKTVWCYVMVKFELASSSTSICRGRNHNVVFSCEIFFVSFFLRLYFLPVRSVNVGYYWWQRECCRLVLKMTIVVMTL